VKINNKNVVALRDARRAVADFERTFGLSTREMLMCAEGDPRLAQIDGFDLMDWHYALEQINALDDSSENNVIETFHGAAFESHSWSAFQYTNGTFRELVNSAEPELLLVA
jgi:hypothetical protein